MAQRPYTELQRYLRKLYNKGTIFLMWADRKELIETINAKSNGKLLKRASSINKVLEERKINFRIKPITKQITFVDENGNKIRRRYKSAWRIIKIQKEEK
mgnify:CR=1 FL=1